MNGGIIEIGWLELALASAFMLVAAGLSLALSLRLGKPLLMGALRTYAQLLALGFVLRWIFAIDAWWLVCTALLIMTLFAVQIALSRVKNRPPGLFGDAFAAISLSGVVVLFTVTAAIIHVHPWHKAQYILPLAGMIFGNAMNAVAIALDRLFDDLRKRRPEVHDLLALGASPWEAALPSIRTSVSAGMIPIINSMNAVGIVSIPGMMTGQILAGADPTVAAPYQIVVMLMLSAATAGGAMIAVRLAYARAFGKDAVFTLPPASKSKS
jgi:putative ABC transport system permease protein